MKNQSAKVLIFSVIFLSLFITPAESNEMQYHIVCTGLNLGWAATMVELQGISPQNRSYIEKYLSDAAAHVGEINSLLRAPFTTLDMPAVIREINRFWSYTASWSISRRANYLKNIYNILKQRLSNVYDSRAGMQKSPNCDSSFLDVGYHFGRAHMAAYAGNQTIRQASHSSLTQAIAAGLSLSGRLACGFSGSKTWRALRLSTVDTAKEYEPIFPMIQNMARNAKGLSTSGGKRTPSSPPDAGGTGGLAGQWRSSDGDIIRISGSGNSFTGHVVSLAARNRSGGYSVGELIARFTRVGGNRFAAKFKYAWMDNKGKRNETWVDLALRLNKDSIIVERTSDVMLTRIR